MASALLENKHIEIEFCDGINFVANSNGNCHGPCEASFFGISDRNCSRYFPPLTNL